MDECFICQQGKHDAAKVLLPPFLSGLNTMFFNHRVWKTCAEKLLAHMALNILAIFLIIKKYNLKT